MGRDRDDSLGPTDKLGRDPSAIVAAYDHPAGGVGASGSFHDAAGALSSIPVPIFWIWMIGTAVVLFRATPGTASAIQTAAD